MNDKINVVQMIIQAGAVGIAILSVYFLYDFASEHVKNNTEVLIRVEEISKAQVTATRDLTEVMRSFDDTLKYNKTLGKGI